MNECYCVKLYSNENEFEELDELFSVPDGVMFEELVDMFLIFKKEKTKNARIARSKNQQFEKIVITTLKLDKVFFEFLF